MSSYHIIILAILFTSTGCGSTSGTGQRVTIDALSTGVGGVAAYYGGGKDPALTTAGAVGGFVVSEGFQAMAKSGRLKAYNSGLEEGKAMGQEEILRGLWEESNGLSQKNSKRYKTLSPALIVPARVQNGVIYDSHTASEESSQPEKILINNPAKSDPHYETFQEKK